MTALESGEHELLKGLWHVGGFMFALGAATYNVAALVQRRESHLVVNAVAYSALTLWEVSKIHHHLSDAA
jgi:hypothetical protein